MELFFLLTGLFIGSIATYLVTKSRFNPANSISSDVYNQLDKEKTVLEDRLIKATEVFQQQKAELDGRQNQILQATSELMQWKTSYKNLEEKLHEQKAEVEQLQEKFTSQFKAIANDILKQNSKEFTDFNQKNIQEILNPLKEKIQTFEKKVEETYDKELRDKISLREEVKKLYELNAKISEEANNLTKALKGDSKKQGNWGEVILERILERSGLVEGEGYTRQAKSMNLTNEEGARLQPDVIINLPDSKHIVVDAKVSLVAYEKLVNCEDDSERDIHMKAHLLSLRTHIKQLSEKDYHTLYGINSPDFVLLFVPIESCFSVAVQADHDLFNFAWEKRVVMVSPSTLLATLRTIASIWKQELQTKNAIEIARQGGALYDKFVGFLDDLKKVGVSIGAAQKAHDEAFKKLQFGSGNLINKVENLKKLGAKATKVIPAELIDVDERLEIEE